MRVDVEDRLTLPWNRPAFNALVSAAAPPERCAGCGRKMTLRIDGHRIKHRVEADNPLAPYCQGDT